MFNISKICSIWKIIIFNKTTFDIASFQGSEVHTPQNIDGAEKLYVKDMVMVPTEWLLERRLKPMLSALQVQSSNHLATASLTNVNHQIFDKQELWQNLTSLNNS